MFEASEHSCHLLSTLRENQTKVVYFLVFGTAESYRVIFRMKKAGQSEQGYCIS